MKKALVVGGSAVGLILGILFQDPTVASGMFGMTVVFRLLISAVFGAVTGDFIHHLAVRA